MKKFQLLSFAIVLAATFTACVKEESPEPVSERLSIWIGLGKQFNTCRESTFLCIRADNIDRKTLPTLALGTDDAVSEPVALDNGAIQMSMDVDVERLSPRVRRQLLEQRVMIVEEDFVLSESLMRQAYQNAGLPYNGQRAEVLKGTYDAIPVGGSGAVPQRIKITITIKDGVLTITVTW